MRSHISEGCLFRGFVAISRRVFPEGWGPSRLRAGSHRAGKRVVRCLFTFENEALRDEELGRVKCVYFLNELCRSDGEVCSYESCLFA